MASTLDQVAADALSLSSDGRALLVEKLLGSLSGDVTPSAEKAHLDDVRRRRDAVRSGQSKLIEGDEALKKARSAIGR